jgi:hypothetical protein
VLSGLDQKTTVSKSWQLAAIPLRNNRSDHWIRLHLVLVSEELTRFYQKPTRVCVCVCVCVGWGGDLFFMSVLWVSVFFVLLLVFV